MVNEGEWFNQMHKMRRHTDNQTFESEKSAAKSRYTTAEVGVTTAGQGLVYKNPTYRKKKDTFRRASVEDFEFVASKKKTLDVPPPKYTSRPTSDSFLSASGTRSTGISINSVSSLRRSLLKRNKSFAERNFSLINQLKNLKKIEMDASSRDTEVIKRNYVTYGGITKKTLAKFFNMINKNSISEPRDISLLLEYFTYPTRNKVFYSSSWVSPGIYGRNNARSHAKL